MRMRGYRLLLLAGVTLAAGACNDHSPVGAVKPRLYITDRGIAVPIPPPSLKAAPEVEASIFGSIVDDFDDGTQVHLADTMGPAEAATEARNDAFEIEVSDDEVAVFDFMFEGVPIDLTANCLEMWIDHGQDLSTYQARIVEEDGGEERAVMTEVESCDVTSSEDGAGVRGGVLGATRR